jgi:hypothetical protein
MNDARKIAENLTLQKNELEVKKQALEREI